MEKATLSFLYIKNIANFKAFGWNFSANTNPVRREVWNSLSKQINKQTKYVFVGQMMN